MSFGGRGLMKGWATWGFQGFAAPAAAAPSSINTGLVLPTALTAYGALGNDLDGRKLALMDGTGGWLVLPDVYNSTGESYSCYNSDGTLRWTVAATGINASCTRWSPLMHYDTIENLLYVGGHSADLSVSTNAVHSGYQGAINITTGAISNTATVANCFAPIPGKFSTAQLTATMMQSRAGSALFRAGMGAGNFVGRWLGVKQSTAAGVDAIYWGNSKYTPMGSTWVQYSGYAGANDDIWIDYFNYGGTLRILRGGQYGVIGWNNIPSGGPTYSGGLTGQTTLPQYCVGVSVVNWGQNQVALVGNSTELIFGQRYYTRSDFDQWLHNVADYLGLAG